mgnify:CR=1 FL=1
MRIISSQSFFLYAARTTVISTETEQSGVEWRNLGPHGTGPIVVGDLSTQSLNGVQIPLSSYRHAAPLEMTCRRPALQSWGKETNNIDTIRPTVISTKALQSGELSGLNGTSASPSHCHFDRNGAKRSGVEKSPASMAPVPPPPHCHFDRSAA